MYIDQLYNSVIIYNLYIYNYITMKALKLQTLGSHTAIVVSKYSSLISLTIDVRRSYYRSSKVDTSITSSEVDTSIIDLRRATHPFPKVVTSISEGRHIMTSNFEGRHIDLQRATYRSSKVDTSDHRSSKVDASIFEDRRRKHRTYNSSSNIVHNCAPKSLE